jgi:[CysO sulfur-carrier protein]-S-L-cysteine hydrolase
VVVPAAIRRRLEEHAAAEDPNEACGLIAFRDGVAERYVPCDNAAESPYRFELRPRDPMDFFLEDEGYELAVFHSHPTDSARPSRTDIANVGLWQGRPYLILSRPTGELAAWQIEGGAVEPLPLEPDVTLD